ncbi:MAG: hypothetical protein QG635_891 [Bacteroidota bacterium]|nr:hypothetical protein [Bacteroidota bacterium]
MLKKEITPSFFTSQEGIKRNPPLKKGEGFFFFLFKSLLNAVLLPISSTRTTVYILIFSMAILTSGCGLFETRDPEPPETARSNFVPPTSPDLVIQNLESSISEKNPDNYKACLSSGGDNPDYMFVPTAEAKALYGSIFSSWTIESERSSFQSIISKIGESSPALNLYNLKQDVLIHDSAVYIADYILDVNFNIFDNQSRFTGKLQFTITKEQSGLWSITNWVDSSVPNDTIKYSWSILKAVYYN